MNTVVNVVLSNETVYVCITGRLVCTVVEVWFCVPCESCDEWKVETVNVSAPANVATAASASTALIVERARKE